MSDQRLRELGARIEDSTPIHPFDDLVARAHRRVAVRRGGALAAVVAVMVVAGFAVPQMTDRDRDTSPSPIDRIEQTPPEGPTPTPTPVRGELVLRFQSWADVAPPSAAYGRDVAVYADGWVIWAGRHEGYLQMRLTAEGVNRLTARTRSTGLFERNLALGIDDRSGQMEVHRGDRSVMLAWGGEPDEVPEGMQDEFVAATAAQAEELIALDEFLRDPVAWELPPRMIERREASQFIPTQLWVGWDRSTPDPSRLPPPAQEVVTRNLEPVLDGSCDVISLAQAKEMAQAMEQVGPIESDDVTTGIAFDMPGQGNGTSFLHAHPSLPHETGSCD